MDFWVGIPIASRGTWCAGHSSASTVDNCAQENAPDIKSRAFLTGFGDLPQASSDRRSISTSSAIWPSVTFNSSIRLTPCMTVV